jgi:hypothetical protein
MAHASTNFATKKDLKLAVADGKQIRLKQSDCMFPLPDNGRVTVEGPWEYHKWYADCTLSGGVITKVR